MSTPTIMVVGSLDQIVDKLEQVEQLCGHREMVGFHPEELEFEYEFVAAADCCRHCAAIDGFKYRGPFILSDFPFAEQVSDEVWFAHYHLNCKCLLKLVNKVDGAVHLLYVDLVVVEG